MSAFNERLGRVLTERREYALEKIKKDKRYIENKNKTDELINRLNSLISEQAQGVLNEYLEAATATHSMECNSVLLSGLTLSAEIQKRFDGTTPEYKEFEEEYL